MSNQLTFFVVHRSPVRGGRAIGRCNARHRLVFFVVEVSGDAVRDELADLLDQIANADNVFSCSLRIAAGHSHGSFSQRDQGVAHTGFQTRDGSLRGFVALNHFGPHEPFLVCHRLQLLLRVRR